MSRKNRRVLNYLNYFVGVFSELYGKSNDMMMIMIAGPYRSGTDNDPKRIKQNMDNLEAMALPIFKKGHVPMIGEWAANPLIELAGSKEVGDAIFKEIQYPVAHRLLAKCDGILRINGASVGADQDVEVAKKLGLKIYYHLSEIPDAE